MIVCAKYTLRGNDSCLQDDVTEIAIAPFSVPLAAASLPKLQCIRRSDSSRLSGLCLPNYEATPQTMKAIYMKITLSSFLNVIQ
jgi:hypothetical protein